LPVYGLLVVLHAKTEFDPWCKFFIIYVKAIIIAERQSLDMKPRCLGFSFLIFGLEVAVFH
jgi:hypothetical protein